MGDDMKFQKAKVIKDNLFKNARSVNPIVFDRIMKGASFDYDNTGSCWEFTARKNPDGYGYLKIGKQNKRCHREIYLMFHTNENPFVVRHICNNPACINPAHLRGGTQKDNAEDRVNSNRGGYLKGSFNGRSKLTNDDVLFIRKSELSGAELGRMFNITDVQALKIKKLKAWRHI